MSRSYGTAGLRDQRGQFLESKEVRSPQLIQLAAHVEVSASQIFWVSTFMMKK